MKIKKCPVEEAAAVGAFYDSTIKFMDDNGCNYPKWIYKIFPTTNYAVDSAKENNLFVCVDGEKILTARTWKKIYRALRLDIVPSNFPAKKLYEACGFKFVGAADLGRTFSGVEQFCLYERNL